MRHLPQLTALALVIGTSAGHAVLVGCGSSEKEEVGAGVSAIVFVKRQHTVVGANGVTVDVAGGNGQVLDYERYVPGGSLMLLSPARPDGILKNITADYPQADINGADVSFDGKQVVFSMKRDPQDHYHIYTAQLAEGPNGKFEIHQRTGGDHNDITPIYIAGGRIAFVTDEMYTPMGTRADEYNHGRASRSSRPSRSTAATPTGASRRRTSLTRSRRSFATTARSATRAGSTSAR